MWISITWSRCWISTSLQRSGTRVQLAAEATGNMTKDAKKPAQKRLINMGEGWGTGGNVGAGVSKLHVFHNPKRQFGSCCFSITRSVSEGIFILTRSLADAFWSCAIVFRGKAPDVYLAQPNGLGPRKPMTCRANGPAVYSDLYRAAGKWPGLWPLGFFASKTWPVGPG